MRGFSYNTCIQFRSVNFLKQQSEMGRQDGQNMAIGWGGGYVS